MHTTQKPSPAAKTEEAVRTAATEITMARTDEERETILRLLVDRVTTIQQQHDAHTLRSEADRVRRSAPGNDRTADLFADSSARIVEHCADLLGLNP